MVMKDSQRRAMWAKRMNYNKLNPYMAQKMIDESKGMPKAKWERLWRIAHSHPRNKVTGTELTRDTNYISKQIYGKTYSKLNKAQKEDVNHTSADSYLGTEKTGAVDRWDRPIYKNKYGEILVDIDLGKSKRPNLHRVTKEGEPL